MALADDLQRVERAMERLARIGRSRSAASLRASRAGIDLPGAAQQVLRRVIEHGPIRISDLAGRVHMADAAVSRQVTALEEQGLVARAASPDDGRVALVRATPAGRGAGRRLRRAADAIFQQCLADWSDRDLARLAGLIERLAGDLHRADAELSAPATRPRP
ncbi:MAG: MarR family transcriptional regulator [Myxococcota bacterium]|nr:MarR family transcriptional regulator [Myxococcota bacterium]